MKNVTLTLVLTEVVGTIVEAVIEGVLAGLAAKAEDNRIVHISEGEAVVNGQRVHITDEAPKQERNWVGWWTEEEDGVARDLELSDEDVAELTGRAVNAVHSYRMHHRYIQPSRVRTVEDVERAMKRWTPAETDYVIAAYENEDGPDEGFGDFEIIGQQIGRTAAACRTQYIRATGKSIPRRKRDA